jgi:SNF2 family DNA or RNA helicase
MAGEVDNDEYPGLSYTHSWLPQSICKTLDISFRGLLTNESVQAPQPPEIKIPLRPHQRALVHAMAEREMASMDGIKYENTTTFANYGVLGDEVGTGKSLVVLSYIAAMKSTPGFIQRRNMLYPNSRANFFTTYSKTYTDNQRPSLIIVPHTIYRQWQTYCKAHTNLNVFYAKSHKELYPLLSVPADVSGQRQVLDAIRASDIVLVGNTLYKELHQVEVIHGLQWKRIFIDEADSIYIPGTIPMPTSPFTWFITATWANMIMDGLQLRPAVLEHYQNNQTHYSTELGKWLRDELGIQQYSGYLYGRTIYFRVRSTNWLARFRSEHCLRAMVLLRTSQQFLEESRQMPAIIEQILLCEQPASHRALAGLVSSTVQNMLHAGNIEGALQELGVHEDTPMNIVEAATIEREKELDRLKKTLAFKESIEYASQQAKEAALASLRTKIESVQSQLVSFRERLISVQTEECPICYDDPMASAAALTPCCHRVFCGTCIVTSLTRRLACPMCRAVLKPSQLTQLVKEKKKTEKKDESKLLSKPRQLIKFLKENPEARVLVFSRYENPFVNLERDCDTEGITYHTLRGNKDTIAATIRSFEKGEKRVLFLPTQTAGAGLNLVGATHIVMLHAMTPEEEKQVIGRAYRLGRLSDLHVVRLRHEGETIHT